MNPILLVGAGGHARACIDVIEQEGELSIVGLVGKTHELEMKVLDYPIIGTDEQLPNLLQVSRNALVTLGQIKTSKHRVRLFTLLSKLGFNLTTVISPTAYISSRASIGEGTVLMHGCVVNAGAVIGRNCIVNTNAVIEHDAIIGDHCHISTSVTINGGVKVGSCSFVGSNTCVKEMVTIGNRCMIGMGQRILKNVEDNGYITTL